MPKLEKTSKSDISEQSKLDDILDALIAMVDEEIKIAEGKREFLSSLKL